MEAIAFTQGPQIAGTEVIDSSDVHWMVLKNIANATAQPREGQYYKRVEAVAIPVEPEPVYIKVRLDARDFKIVDVIGADGITVIDQTIRIIRG